MDELNDRQCQILSELADPEREIVANDLFSVFSIEELFLVAEKHHVWTIVYRKVRECRGIASTELEHKIAALKENVRLQAAVMLDLDVQGAKLGKRLVEEGIPHRFVKGQIFANELYTNLNDRPYTDVDIVVPESHFLEAISIGESTGFTHNTNAVFDNTMRDREAKLTLPGSPHLLIEVHGNLVHMRALRRAKKIGFPELEQAYDWSTPFVGHFVVAIAHASLGHKFHNLKLMVDCLQAMRKLDEKDLAHLAVLVKAFNLSTEVKACLDLCCAIFTAPDVLEKAELISKGLSLRPQPTFVRGIDVLQAPFKQSLQSRWRRRLFRLYQL